MAIFPEYAMPKYKSPIRITKPYQKPNYLADAIIGGMGAYTNIQGMNLKKEMFAAQMAQQQKAIADKAAETQFQQDYIRRMLEKQVQYAGGVQAQSPINLPGTQETFYEGYQGGMASPMRTQPFAEMHSDDGIADALQYGMQTQNPLANVARALQLQGLIDPKPKEDNWRKQLALGRFGLSQDSAAFTKQKYDAKQAGLLKTVAEERYTQASNLVGSVFGDVLKPGFKYKDYEWKNEDYSGLAAQKEYLKNMEWEGEKGVQAYQQMIMDLTGYANAMLEKNVPEQKIKLWLLEMASGSAGNPLADVEQSTKHYRTGVPTIPAALQEQIDDLKASNAEQAANLPSS